MKPGALAARCALCVVMLVSAASTAAAQGRPTTERPSKAATEEGRERFKRGVALFRDGDYRAALIEFNRANEVAPNAKIHFNVAQTCLEMQEYACALRAFERFLGEGGADVPKQRRQESERELERLRKLVGYVKITSNKNGADVTLDDAPIGQTPLPDPVLVGAGRHKITVSLAPLTPASRVVDVAGGDEVNVAMDLAEPVPVAPVVTPLGADAQPRPAASSELPAEPLRPSRAPFWVGFVTTGVLAAGAGVTGVLALSANADLDSTAARFPVTPSEVESARTKVQTLSTVTDVLMVSAIVAAGITTILFFTSSPPPRRAAGPRPASSLLDGTF